MYSSAKDVAKMAYIELYYQILLFKLLAPCLRSLLFDFHDDMLTPRIQEPINGRIVSSSFPLLLEPPLYDSLGSWGVICCQEGSRP